MSSQQWSNTAIPFMCTSTSNRMCSEQLPNASVINSHFHPSCNGRFYHWLLRFNHTQEQPCLGLIFHSLSVSEPVWLSETRDSHLVEGPCDSASRARLQDGEEINFCRFLECSDSSLSGERVIRGEQIRQDMPVFGISHIGRSKQYSRKCSQSISVVYSK